MMEKNIKILEMNAMSTSEDKTGNDIAKEGNIGHLKTTVPDFYQPIIVPSFLYNYTTPYSTTL